MTQFAIFNKALVTSEHWCFLCPYIGLKSQYRPHQKNAIAHVSEHNAYYFMDLTFFVELCDVITYNMTNS